MEQIPKKLWAWYLTAANSDKTRAKAAIEYEAGKLFTNLVNTGNRRWDYNCKDHSINIPRIARILHDLPWMKAGQVVWPSKYQLDMAGYGGIYSVLKKVKYDASFTMKIVVFTMN